MTKWREGHEWMMDGMDHASDARELGQILTSELGVRGERVRCERVRGER